MSAPPAPELVGWGDFCRRAPDLAARGRAILYHYGVPLGYLATVRPDGGPRLHPFSPILHGEGLWGLIGPSPKRRDLLRDGRYAIHAFPLTDRDDEFYVTGRAFLHEDSALARAVREAYVATGARSDGSEKLFEFRIERVLLASYKERGAPDNWPPVYSKWSVGDA